MSDLAFGDDECAEDYYSIYDKFSVASSTDCQTIKEDHDTESHRRPPPRLYSNSSSSSTVTTLNDYSNSLGSADQIQNTYGSLVGHYLNADKEDKQVPKLSESISKVCAKDDGKLETLTPSAEILRQSSFYLSFFEDPKQDLKAVREKESEKVKSCKANDNSLLSDGPERMSSFYKSLLDATNETNDMNRENTLPEENKNKPSGNGVLYPSLDPLIQNNNNVFSSEVPCTSSLTRMNSFSRFYKSTMESQNVNTCSNFDLNITSATITDEPKRNSSFFLSLMPTEKDIVPSSSSSNELLITSEPKRVSSFYESLLKSQKLKSIDGSANSAVAASATEDPKRQSSFHVSFLSSLEKVELNDSVAKSSDEKISLTEDPKRVSSFYLSLIRSDKDPSCKDGIGIQETNEINCNQSTTNSFAVDDFFFEKGEPSAQILHSDRNFDPPENTKEPVELSTKAVKKKPPSNKALLNTWKAIANGESIIVVCMGCKCKLQVSETARKVYCMQCESVTDLKGLKYEKYLPINDNDDALLSESLQYQEFIAPIIYGKGCSGQDVQTIENTLATRPYHGFEEKLKRKMEMFSTKPRQPEKN